MNSDLQKKLQEFAPTPPPAVWERVARSLDEQETFPQRLYAYEETPPPGVWNAVQSRLDKPRAKVVALPGTRLWRYAAAAAAAVFIGLFLFRQNGSEILPPQTTTAARAEKTPVVVDAPPPKMLNQPAHMAVASAMVSPKTSRRSTAFIKPLLISGALALNNSFIPRRAASDNPLSFADADNYMVYSDENGTALRLPKKMVPLVACSTEDFPCQERLRQLQTKLASAGLANDFTGLLDLVRQLQQKP